MEVAQGGIARIAMNHTSSKLRVGVIIGTGAESLAAQLQAGQYEISKLKVNTRYGDSALLQLNRQRSEQYGDEVEVYILLRHGFGHRLPPHLINYKANIAALKRLNVDGVIATAAVGALHDSLSVGGLIVPDQLVDWTRQRPLTFFDECNAAVHVDMTKPFCERLRQLLLTSAKHVGIDVKDGGCYFCTDGPRYETAAEVKVMRMLNGDVVGMTASTEAILAREASLCYSLICIVTNYAAGVLDSRPSHHEVEAAMQMASAKLLQLLAAAIELYEGKDCTCKHSLDGYDVRLPL